MTTKTGHTPTLKVTWDGQGINNTDEYASRIAKFQPEYLHLGGKIAIAVNSHEALLNAAKKMRDRWTDNDNTTKEEYKAFEDMCIAINEAERN